MFYKKILINSKYIKTKQNIHFKKKFGKFFNISYKIENQFYKLKFLKKEENS